MNPEETQEEETTTPEEESEETVDADTDTETEDESEEEDESGSSDQEIDWEQIAKDEEEKRKKAEQALATDRFKNKHKKKADDDFDDEEDDEEDRPLTKKEFDAILARERAETRREVMSGRIKELARAEVKGETNEDAASAAIIAIHGNLIFPEGTTLEQQIKQAKYIAYGPRLEAKITELRRSIKSKNTAKKSGNEGTHRDPTTPAPKMGAADRSEMQRLGFKWNGKEYTKNISGGKELVFDTKTNKRYTRKTS